MVYDNRCREVNLQCKVHRWAEHKSTLVPSVVNSDFLCGCFGKLTVMYACQEHYRNKNCACPILEKVGKILMNSKIYAFKSVGFDNKEAIIK